MNEVIVKTIYGKVCGQNEKGINVFRGIPYAKPPVGELRFCPPQTPKSWGDEIRDATKFGNRAMQNDSPVSGAEPANEDCLYLNVWTPKKIKQPLPVMVWIHGGAFLMGSASDPMYDCRVFTEQGGVISVSLNYRLGIFGFLHLGSITENEKFASSGNAGLLDQIEALRWIKENIKYFGGDPKNITIFGESAGAISVANLLVMPDAKGLFDKAIIQSSGDPVMLSNNADSHVKEVFKLLNIAEADIKKLQEVPAEKLLGIQSNFPTMSFSPVVDGVTIPDDPHILAAQGKAKGIPVIIGANKDEYRLFASIDTGLLSWNAEDVRKNLIKIFKPVWSDMEKYYKDISMDLDLYIQTMNYATFLSPTTRYTTSLSEHAKIFSYFFTYEHPVFKAGHGLDLQFVFKRIGKSDGMFQIKGYKEKKLSDQMFKAWIAFANTGDPNIRQLPYWPTYGKAERKVINFNLRSFVEKDPHTDREFWDNLVAKKEYKEVVLEMATDMISAKGSLENDESVSNLQQKEGYYSVHDTVGDLMKNRKTETILYSIGEAMKSSDGGGMKMNKMMIRMMSKMTLIKVAKLAGDKFPKGLLEQLNDELMKIKKK